MALILGYIVIGLSVIAVLIVLSEHGIGWEDVKAVDAEADREGAIIAMGIFWPVALLLAVVMETTRWVLYNVFNKER